MRRFTDEIRTLLIEGIDDMECEHCYLVKSIPYSEAFVSFVRKNLEKPNEILAYEPPKKSGDLAIILICQTSDNTWRMVLVFDPIDPFQPYELFGLVVLENFAETDLSRLNADKIW